MVAVLFQQLSGWEAENFNNQSVQCGRVEVETTVSTCGIEQNSLSYNGNLIIIVLEDGFELNT